MKHLTILASDLQEGDLVHLTAGVDVRITALSSTAKTVSAVFIYEACDFSPERIGRKADHRFRVATEVNITRG